ncbi:hypothetical protein [Paraburkholderia pallida]|uniref:Uncharacterized protein n=1 Tax=Paraburkholderia pallida TaxID=2547399 RepID=A0A4P7DAK9_9BURK|nr:hypothetical protein [Paraburkholderia pallida]QBR03954.1 hypothetical protein E1956_42870 [Paraburkholderia pallida]
MAGLHRGGDQDKLVQDALNPIHSYVAIGGGNHLGRGKLCNIIGTILTNRALDRCPGPPIMSGRIRSIG